jgi:hypothetical protein
MAVSSQRRFSLGWVPDLPDHRDLMYSTPLQHLQQLPASVDLRPHISFAPYDQGRIGSCTANAIAAAVQFDRIKMSQAPDFTPSRLFIYYNERAMEHHVPSDAGAQIRDGIKSVAKLGACRRRPGPTTTRRPIRIRNCSQPAPDPRRSRRQPPITKPRSTGRYRISGCSSRSRR